MQNSIPGQTIKTEGCQIDFRTCRVSKISQNTHSSLETTERMCATETRDCIKKEGVELATGDPRKKSLKGL